MSYRQRDPDWTYLGDESDSDYESDEFDDYDEDDDCIG
jgi:hypothetical protein